MSGCPFSSSRRRFLGSAAGAAAAAAAASGAIAAGPARAAPASGAEGEAVPFDGPHQGGIETPQQANVVFAGFDVVTADRAAVAALLDTWTTAARRMSRGEPASPDRPDTLAPSDSGEVLGLPPRRLTITFGFGPSLFSRNGIDRFGLASRRPAALVDLPTFNGDQLDPKYCGGDLLVQACADDQTTAFHAVRQLARLAAGNDTGNGYGGKRAGATEASDAIPPTASMRWLQTGFLPGAGSGETPRNLLGFRDGTQNPGVAGPAEIADGKVLGNGGFGEYVWAQDADAPWMHGGSYLVLRRIRLTLEHWDRVPIDFQEQVIGRTKATGAPLTGGTETSPLDLDKTDADGNPVIPATAHARLASASANRGARIFRRSYAYNDGLGMVAERWPPWRQGLEYDAGLLFAAYGSDPRAGFIPMFDRMSKLDMLNQFATHTGSAVFALPGGVGAGGAVGAGLFGIA